MKFILDKYNIEKLDCALAFLNKCSLRIIKAIKVTKKSITVLLQIWDQFLSQELLQKWNRTNWSFVVIVVIMFLFIYVFNLGYLSSCGTYRPSLFFEKLFQAIET